MHAALRDPGPPEASEPEWSPFDIEPVQLREAELDAKAGDNARATRSPRT